MVQFRAVKRPLVEHRLRFNKRAHGARFEEDGTYQHIRMYEPTILGIVG